MSSNTIVVGPWGGPGGIHWDDGVYNGIREITIFSSDCINSISIVYDKHGDPVTPGKHGGIGGSGAEIKLQYPDEYLVSASGYYSKAPSPVVTSLTLETNKGAVYGPYGPEEGTPFTLPVEGGRVVGFTGRSDRFLEALGFRLTPNS